MKLQAESKVFQYFQNSTLCGKTNLQAEITKQMKDL